MIIQEFLPNPVGNDKEGEYIKLFNDSNKTISLNGWEIKDAANKTFRLSGNLGPKKELLLPYSQTKIFLNNNGEEVSLYNPSGIIVDKLNYSGQAEEGEVIMRIMNNESGIMEIEYGQLNNTQNSWPQLLFIIFLTGLALAWIGSYIVLQLEKKLDIKLF